MSSADSHKVTLKEWINDNERLLTVTGVFVALSAYFSQLTGMGRYLVFISFAMSLLLLVEVWTSLPKDKEKTYPLTFFRMGLFVLVLYMGGYFVETYRTPLLEYSAMWLWGVYLSVEIVVLQKTGAGKWLAFNWHRSGWKGFISSIIVGTTLLAVPALFAIGTHQLITLLMPP